MIIIEHITFKSF